MMKRLVLSLAVLAGCDLPVAAPVGIAPSPSETSADAGSRGSRITAPPPPPGARTVDQLDTTSAAERAAAKAPLAVPKTLRLGTTIAALGDPMEPGIWIKTPLVDKIVQGRAETAGGKSIGVELRPLVGASGGGSQISLPAMRLMGVGLTDLPELVLYRLP